MSEFSQYAYRNRHSLASKFRRYLWSWVWTLLFRTTPAWTLHRWRLFLLRLFGGRIGGGCRVSPTCRIWAPWNLEMGEYSVLGDDVDCYCVDRIRLGSKVAISQRTFLCTATHDISTFTRELRHSPIEIADHAWICAEAFVGPGVTIGEGAVVGARAFVYKNIPPWAIVSGNPAVQIGTREICTTKQEPLTVGPGNSVVETPL